MLRLFSFYFLFIFLNSFDSTSQQLTNIPDDNFEQHLINIGVDDILDDYVLTSNISSLTSLQLAVGDNIIGIEDFTSLDYLRLEGSGGNETISAIDLSQINWVSEITIYAISTLTDLILPQNNSSLEYLNINSNTNLSSILLPIINSSLTHLNIHSNAINSIDLTNQQNLYYLNLQGDISGAVNFSGNSQLKHLRIKSPPINEIDLSNNTLLESFHFVSAFNISNLD